MNNFVWSEIRLPATFYAPGVVTFAEAFSISPSGSYIVGTFGPRNTDPNRLLAGPYHGFLRAANSIPGIEAFGSFDYPDNPMGSTSMRGINDNGEFVGFYRDQSRSNEIHGYVKNNDPHPFQRLHALHAARPLDVDLPNSSFVSTDLDGRNLHNAALGINHQGSIVVGVFKQAEDLRDLGYVWGPAGPEVDEEIDHGPLIVEAQKFGEDVTSTMVRAINNAGHIVGSFTRNGSGKHGYKWAVEHDSPFFDGRPVVIDIPSPAGNTEINGINNHGWIVGSYQTFEPRPDNRPTDHGFFWKPDSAGRYVPGEHVIIDIFGAMDTVVNGIASDGTCVGYYRAPYNTADATIVRHAFVGKLLS